jgi:hypothetical protein
VLSSGNRQLTQAVVAGAVDSAELDHRLALSGDHARVAVDRCRPGDAVVGGRAELVVVGAAQGIGRAAGEL